MDSFPNVNMLLPMNITVFTFDFSGCGMSEGEFISLGWNERDDLEAVIKHMREKE
jgi:alpha/beta superfamily hydrolase